MSASAIVYQDAPLDTGCIAQFIAAAWVLLPPGPAGQVLASQGPGLPLAWETAAGQPTGNDLQQYYSPPAVATWTGTVTLNLSNNNLFVGTLSGNTTLAFAGGDAGQPITIYAAQAASGGPFTLTFPASVVAWSGSPYSAPSMPVTAGAYLLANLRCLPGGSTFVGSWAGNTNS
jgi:hypothetical protein